MTNIIFLIIGIIIGCVVIYIKTKPRLVSVQKLDEDIANQNKELHNQLVELNKEYSSLTARKEEILSNISLLQKQAEESTNNIFEKSYELANERMSQAADEMAKQYERATQSAEKEYLLALEGCMQSFAGTMQEKQRELQLVESKLKELSSKLSAAVEAAKRHEEEKQKQNFYRLQLSDEDISEIAKIREITPYLRNSEPLNKVIWKVYYEKPCTDMIGRVVGTGTHTGIYKITNIDNQMCYVGQAANIADRWKQHIKRGIGAETPTRNKLYPAMLAIGVENFTFEIIEECDRGLLNEREDYWQDYFHARSWGYSIK